MRLKEKVDLLKMQYSPEAVEEFIIVWCMLIAHIHEGLYNCIDIRICFLKSAFYLCVPAKQTLLFMLIYFLLHGLYIIIMDLNRQAG